MTVVTPLHALSPGNRWVGHELYISGRFGDTYVLYGRSCGTINVQSSYRPWKSSIARLKKVATSATLMAEVTAHITAPADGAEAADKAAEQLATDVKAKYVCRHVNASQCFVRATFQPIVTTLISPLCSGLEGSALCFGVAYLPLKSRVIDVLVMPAVPTSWTAADPLLSLDPLQHCNVCSGSITDGVRACAAAAVI